MHPWLARYEREGMEGMGDQSHRPTHRGRPAKGSRRPRSGVALMNEPTECGSTLRRQKAVPRWDRTNK